MKNADKPINPVMMQQVGENEFRASKPSDQKEWNIPTEGLTKREYYAGLALQGTCSNQEFLKNLNGDPNLVIKACIEIADELLKQLEEK